MNPFLLMTLVFSLGFPVGLVPAGGSASASKDQLPFEEKEEVGGDALEILQSLNDIAILDGDAVSLAHDQMADRVITHPCTIGTPVDLISHFCRPPPGR